MTRSLPKKSSDIFQKGLTGDTREVLLTKQANHHSPILENLPAILGPAREYLNDDGDPSALSWTDA
jgi:hypothetical protein